MSYLQLYQIQTTTACEFTVLYNQATSNKEKRTVQQRLLAICLYTAQQAITSQKVVDRVKILDILQNISSRSLQTRKTTKSSLQITNQTSFSFVSIPSYSYPYENTLLQCSFAGSTGLPGFSTLVAQNYVTFKPLICHFNSYTSSS